MHKFQLSNLNEKSPNEFPLTFSRLFTFCDSSFIFLVSTYSRGTEIETKASSSYFLLCKRSNKLYCPSNNDKEGETNKRNEEIRDKKRKKKSFILLFILSVVKSVTSRMKADSRNTHKDYNVNRKRLSISFSQVNIKKVAKLFIKDKIARLSCSLLLLLLFSSCSDVNVILNFFYSTSLSLC